MPPTGDIAKLTRSAAGKLRAAFKSRYGITGVVTSADYGYVNIDDDGRNAAGERISISYAEAAAVVRDVLDHEVLVALDVRYDMWFAPGMGDDYGQRLPATFYPDAESFVRHLGPVELQAVFTDADLWGNYPTRARIQWDEIGDDDPRWEVIAGFAASFDGDSADAIALAEAILGIADGTDPDAEATAEGEAEAEAGSAGGPQADTDTDSDTAPVDVGADVEAITDAAQAWLDRLVSDAKRTYARAWIDHLRGVGEAPADPGTDWAAKVRTKATRYQPAAAAAACA